MKMQSPCPVAISEKKSPSKKKKKKTKYVKCNIKINVCTAYWTLFMTEHFYSTTSMQ